MNCLKNLANLLQFCPIGSFVYSLHFLMILKWSHSDLELDPVNNFPLSQASQAKAE